MQTGDVTHVDSISQVSFPTPWSRKTFIRELEEGPYSHYWVVRPNLDMSEHTQVPQILAYGGMWILDHEAHILIFATHAEWRRCGIGEWLLLNMLIASSERGAESVTLEVRAGNQAAKVLYENVGFEEAGRRKNYYKTNDPTRQHEDAIILTLQRLDPAWVEKRLHSKMMVVQAQFHRCLAAANSREVDRR